MVAICGWKHDGRGRGEAPERCRPPALFDEKERMVVARINRICNFAITYFTDKSEFDEVRQMTIQTVEQNNILCAVINSDEKVFTDAQSALDVLMTAKYNVGTKNIIIDKKLIVEDFFILSTGLAGEILQKYTNYGGRIAIYGDYSRYTSKPLRDFIYESNKGKSVFFVATKEEAIEMLTK